MKNLLVVALLISMASFASAGLYWVSSTGPFFSGETVTLTLVSTEPASGISISALVTLLTMVPWVVLRRGHSILHSQMAAAV